MRRVPSRAPSRALASLVAGILVGSIACSPADERPVDARSMPAVGAGDTALSRGDSILPRVPPPVLLASACLRGDPTQALPWTLDSVEAIPLAVMPIETLASRDSAQLAARIARMADVLPSDTSLADFRGLPVVVRAAWRVVPDGMDTVVVALVARRIPMESAPLEEVLLVVASPGARANVHDPLVALWSAREVGTEESVRVRELVGAHLREGALSLLLLHETPEGPSVELVELRDGTWITAWEGRIPECPAG